MARLPFPESLRRWPATLLAGLLIASAAAAQGDVAAGVVTPPRAEALARAQDAMVGLFSQAVEDAGSNATLGRRRQGSGVVIGGDGLVLTIGYLILDADQVDLVVEGERVVPARVVAYDQATGFGLVQALAPLKVAPVRLGRSVAIDGSEPLMVASGGAEGEMSLARLVSQRAFSGYWEYHIDRALFTVPARTDHIDRALFTVPARTDHSGAGLFNLDGELLGIGSLVVSEASGAGRGGQPGNMFVPVELLVPILGELRAQGMSRGSARPWLGINYAESEGSVQVVRVTRDSPAERGGLLPGDLILRIDGAEVGALETLYERLWRDGPERDVELVIRRGEDTQTLTVHALDRMSTLRKPQGI